MLAFSQLEEEGFIMEMMMVMAVMEMVTMILGIYQQCKQNSNRSKVSRILG